MTLAKGELAGKRVVLTGATGGIGRATAARLAGSGAELVLVARRDDALGELAERLGAASIRADMESPEAVAALAERVDELWSDGPDVLINNAGTFGLASFAETTSSAFERHYAVNLRAPFELIRHWLSGMQNRGSGHVVNVGSIAGRKAFPGNAAYAASKFALRALHEVLVEELRDTGVKVTWIEPSAVDTALWDPHEPDARDDLPDRGAMLRPEAVAESIHFAVAQPDSVAIEEIAIRANARAGVAIAHESQR